MKTLSPLFSMLMVAAMLVLTGCESTNDLASIYRMEKRYWTPHDYENAVRQMKYNQQKEKKPCYAVPEKAAIFQKIIDQSNLSVVIEDEELGLEHRAEFASEMFDSYKDLTEVYSETNREDLYVYPRELVEIMQFGLYLQLHYFFLGNEAIRENADNAEDRETRYILERNEDACISNFCLYLDLVKGEERLTEEARSLFVEGINEYFPQLLQRFPNADYAEMRKKTRDMLAKTDNPNTEAALNQLLTNIGVLAD